MKRISYCIIILLFFSCSKESDKISTTLLDSIPTDKYYKSEIFSEVNLKLYGQLKFLNIYDYAGIAGGPGKEDPTYDVLEIKKYGIYGKIKNNRLIESGKIEIVKQDSIYFEINFRPDTSNVNVYNWWYVNYSGKDSIIMYDASVGCGSYSHVYIKK
jgi:hypothetical protein